ncbi:MAG: hypothetical protein WA954_01255, partial [Parerythrobacter sp.]
AYLVSQRESRLIEKAADKKLRSPIKMKIIFKPYETDVEDRDIDFKIRIAPNNHEVTTQLESESWKSAFEVHDFDAQKKDMADKVRDITDLIKTSIKKIKFRYKRGTDENVIVKGLLGPIESRLAAWNDLINLIDNRKGGVDLQSSMSLLVHRKAEFVKHINRIKRKILTGDTIEQDNKNIVKVKFVYIDPKGVVIGNEGKEVHIRYRPSIGFKFEHVPDIGFSDRWYVFRESVGQEESYLHMSLNRHSFRHCDKYRNTSVKSNINSLYYFNVDDSTILMHCKLLAYKIALEYKFGNKPKLNLVGKKGKLRVSPTFSIKKEGLKEFLHFDSKSFEIETGHKFTIDKINHFFVTEGDHVLDRMNSKDWNATVAWARALQAFGPNFYELDEYRRLPTGENHEDRRLEDYKEAMNEDPFPSYHRQVSYNLIKNQSESSDFRQNLRKVSGGQVPDGQWFTKRKTRK